MDEGNRQVVCHILPVVHGLDEIGGESHEGDPCIAARGVYLDKAPGDYDHEIILLYGVFVKVEGDLYLTFYTECKNPGLDLARKHFVKLQDIAADVVVHQKVDRQIKERNRFVYAHLFARF